MIPVSRETERHTGDHFESNFERVPLYSLVLATQLVKLVDPEGDYDFSDLVSFARLVTCDGWSAAGLKKSGARRLV